MSFLRNAATLFRSSVNPFAPVAGGQLPAACLLSRTGVLMPMRGKKKKAKGTTKNGRDSPGQRLGVKKFAGEFVTSQNILARQRGTKYHAGMNVRVCRDHTLVAETEGVVSFTKVLLQPPRKTNKWRTFINVLPEPLSNFQNGLGDEL